MLNPLTHWDIQVTRWGGKIRVPRSTSSTPQIKLFHSFISSLCVLVRVLRYYLTLLPTVVPCYQCINLVPPKSIHFSGCPLLSWIFSLAYGSPDSQDSQPYACILPVSQDLSMTSLHLTRISGLLDMSFILPDSQDSFNTMYPYPGTSQYVSISIS